MNLKLVMYSSVAKSTSGSTRVPDGLSSIVRHCKRKNPSNEISGALYYRHGRYLQILEGESTRVDQVMSGILKDNRHSDCLIHLHNEINQRTFDRWHPLLNISVAKDPYLRNFLSRYSSELKAMSPDRRIALNHFLKKEKGKVKTKIIQEGRQSTLNVFGDHVISLDRKPDFSKLQLTPLMLDVCRLLERQNSTLEQLVTEYGPSKRDEIVSLLRGMNQKGLLRYVDDEMGSMSHKGRMDMRAQSNIRPSLAL